MTVDATRLMRVTGDCFLAARGVDRFTAAFFRGAAFDALRFVTLFAVLFALVFAFVVPREAARFDAVDDFRFFPPDDFDAVAMIFFLVEGSGRQCARFARTVKRRSSPHRRITLSLRIAIGPDVQLLPTGCKT